MFNTDPDQIPEAYRDPALATIAERMDAHLLAAPPAPPLSEVPPSPVGQDDYPAQRAWVAQIESLCRPLVERAEWEAQFLALEAERSAAVLRSQQRWLDGQVAPYRRALERAAGVLERCEAEDPNDPHQRIALLKKRLHHLEYEHPFELDTCGRPVLCGWNSYLADQLKRARWVVEHPDQSSPKEIEKAGATIAECEPELKARLDGIAAIKAEIAELERQIAEGE